MYEKLLKNKTYANEKKYKYYKNTFEKIKNATKKYYYSNQLKNAEGNAKKTWDTMKEIIGKVKRSTHQLPKQLNYKDRLISEKHEIAESFNEFFVSIGKDFASKSKF